MKILLKGKNALSKEGEENILVLGRCSVLPLILTLGWRAVKPSGCLVGGASAAAGAGYGPRQAADPAALWPFAPSTMGCLKSVSSKLSLKLQVYVVYSAGKEAAG